MTGPAIKLCGLTTPKSLDAAIASRADYVGLNFFPPSPRNISLGDAAALAARTEGRITRVGVFVDASDISIAEAVTAASLDVIQLHGAENPQRAAQLKAQFGLPVWKALTVASKADVARARAYAGAADLILFDAKTPRGSALPGGMGLSFDWSLVANWNGPIAWGLAGGLTAENVGEAIRLTGAPLVDTSSGVESAPGVKDVDKIAAFCKAARSA
ncbi:MAG: phosphoribosylanthranilate isomerase [Novosphingobium sp.]